MRERWRFCLLWRRAAVAAPPDMPRFRWENFTTANGLPDNHVFNVCVDGDRVWAGTENGLALYENGKWTSVHARRTDWRTARCCIVALDKRTGDVWIATMGGLSRYSAGRFDTFTQLNSGLAERCGLRRRACRATTCGWPPPPAAAA